MNLQRQIDRSVAVLNKTGIVILLPQSGSLGVIGIDGREYPVPSREQLQEVFAGNKELVERKARQGFTRLLLTPIALYVSHLIERLDRAIRHHAAQGKINQTKAGTSEADAPLRVNESEPIWIWDRIRLAMDTPRFLYFPQNYTYRDHQGITKEEVIGDSGICAVPGWSIGLIEPLPIMPRQGQGRVLDGRKELEEYSTPREYLQILDTAAYQGESGWTVEDFFIHFLFQLETTNQVSHDRHDGNALWLLGAYLPDLLPNAKLVPVGYWDRDAGRRVRVTAHRSANRLKGWVARTIVRLGG